MKLEQHEYLNHSVHPLSGQFVKSNVFVYHYTVQIQKLEISVYPAFSTIVEFYHLSRLIECMN